MSTRRYHVRVQVKPLCQQSIVLSKKSNSNILKQFERKTNPTNLTI